MTDLDVQPARDDGTRATRARRRAIRVALTSLLVGVLAALAALGVSSVSGESDLFLVAGTEGHTLAFRLWALACLCGIVLSVAGFRLFVIGYEAFTAAMAALFLCALVLAAGIGTLIAGILALLYTEPHYVVLNDLDRAADQRIVVEETAPVHDTSWHIYRGGPLRYEEITESLLTDPDCHRLGANNRWTPFADGDYTLTTDAQGRDVLSFSADDAFCDDDGTYELVLP